MRDFARDEQDLQDLHDLQDLASVCFCPLLVGKARQILTVSIPFQREGVSEQRNRRAPLNKVKFLFPSNGTAFLNAKARVWMYLKKGLMKFRFPSNGTAFPNMQPHEHDADLRIVSIPFHRDGVS